MLDGQVPVYVWLDTLSTEVDVTALAVDDHHLGTQAAPDGILSSAHCITLWYSASFK